MDCVRGEAIQTLQGRDRGVNPVIVSNKLGQSYTPDWAQETFGFNGMAAFETPKSRGTRGF